jgi:hypothetical protein
MLSKNLSAALMYGQKQGLEGDDDRLAPAINSNMVYLLFTAFGQEHPHRVIACVNINGLASDAAA